MQNAGVTLRTLDHTSKNEETLHVHARLLRFSFRLVELGPTTRAEGREVIRPVEKFLLTL